jgi:hypothetical protein
MSNGRQPFDRGVHTQHVSPLCGLSEGVGMIPPGRCTHSPMLAHKDPTRRVRLPIDQRFARAQEVSVGSHGRLEALYPVFSPRVQLYQEVRQPSRFVLNQMTRHYGGGFDRESQGLWNFQPAGCSRNSETTTPRSRAHGRSPREDRSTARQEEDFNKRETRFVACGLSGESHRDLRRLPVSLPGLMHTRYKTYVDFWLYGPATSCY